jgi:FkbM family methyltransferase
MPIGIRRIAKILSGTGLGVRRDISVPTLRLGSAYGGWEILADGLHESAVVYSFGVGEDISFDLELIRRYRVTVQAFDPTARSIEWVRAQQVPSQFVMHEKGVGPFDGQAAFRAPSNPEHVSHSMVDAAQHGDAVYWPVRRIATIMTELGHRRIDLLKMDVEGAEYAVVDDLLAGETRPSQLLVEFHHRLRGVGVHQTTRAIKRLRAAGYRLFAISETGDEYSFVHCPGKSPTAARQ